VARTSSRAPSTGSPGCRRTGLEEVAYRAVIIGFPDLRDDIILGSCGPRSLSRYWGGDAQGDRGTGHLLTDRSLHARNQRSWAGPGARCSSSSGFGCPSDLPDGHSVTVLHAYSGLYSREGAPSSPDTRPAQTIEFLRPTRPPMPPVRRTAPGPAVGVRDSHRRPRPRRPPRSGLAAYRTLVPDPSAVPERILRPRPSFVSRPTSVPPARFDRTNRRWRFLDARAATVTIAARPRTLTRLNGGVFLTAKGPAPTWNDARAGTSSLRGQARTRTFAGAGFPRLDKTQRPALMTDDAASLATSPSPSPKRRPLNGIGDVQGSALTDYNTCQAFEPHQRTPAGQRATRLRCAVTFGGRRPSSNRSRSSASPSQVPGLSGIESAAALASMEARGLTRDDRNDGTEPFGRAIRGAHRHAVPQFAGSSETTTLRIEIRPHPGRAATRSASGPPARATARTGDTGFDEPAARA